MANENRVGRFNVEVAFTQDAETTVRAGRQNVEVAYTQAAGTKARVTQLAVEVLYSEPVPVSGEGGFVIVVM